MLVCLATLLSPSVLLSFLICRGRAGPEKSASVLQGSRSQGTRWKASCQLVSMLGFFTTCQCFSLICYEGPAFRASPCWLAALWPLQVQANLVALRVLPTLQNGVSRLRFCFCLRLDVQVTVSVLAGEVKGINPGFLVLGFSTRTLKSRGGSGKTSSGRGFCVGMLSLVCSTPACPGLMVVVRFSFGPPLLLFGVLLSAQQGSARR